MTDRDALGMLPEFKWRGNAYPIGSSRHSFRHEVSEHRVSYGGLTLVEPLGPQNPTFAYTLPMDQGIARGPYSDLLKKIPTLARDMYNRAPGELTDPLFGTWTVVPQEFSADLDATHRSGVPVQIGFVWAPELDKDVKRRGGVDSVSGLVSDAAALDAVVQKLSRVYDTKGAPPRMDALAAPGAVAAQILRSVEKMQAQIQRITYQVEKTERYATEVLRLARDPDAFGLQRNARRVRASANRLQAEIGATARDVVPVTLAQAKTVLTVAAEAGMSVKDLLAMNVELARSPVVAAGTVVQVFRKKA